jgi:hypothetical protein
MLFRRIFISMISGTPGTTSPRPGRLYSRAYGPSRRREHAGCVDLSASHHDAGSGHRGGVGRSNRTAAVMSFGHGPGSGLTVRLPPGAEIRAD